MSLGNKSRTGLIKPPRSGSPKVLSPGDRWTRFTFTIGEQELDAWKKEAKALGLSLGSLVKGCVRDYVEGEV